MQAHSTACSIYRYRREAGLRSKRGTLRIRFARGTLANGHTLVGIKRASGARLLGIGDHLIAFALRRYPEFITILRAGNDVGRKYTGPVGVGRSGCRRSEFLEIAVSAVLRIVLHLSRLNRSGHLNRGHLLR